MDFPETSLAAQRVFFTQVCVQGVAWGAWANPPQVPPHYLELLYDWLSSQSEAGFIYSNVSWIKSMEALYYICMVPLLCYVW